MNVPNHDPESVCSSSKPLSRLDEITTRWSTLGEPMQFVMRYGPAIRRYLHALIPDFHDAEDVCQDFLTHAITHGFPHASPDRGRFRQYLKSAIRHSALAWYRKRRLPTSLECSGQEPIQPAGDSPNPDQDYVAAWRQCALDRAWTRLLAHQRKNPESNCHSALRVATDYADENRTAHAERLSTLIGRQITHDTFRQQLSRARRLFAEFLIDEVRRTIEHQTPDAIQDELAELDLLVYVSDYLG